MERKPLLSIGIIFKNEIRCLERCMKSLQSLREAIPCELVMADTGSDDGSREVAERYADILFDFPWVDDFAAARNAVMDRCSGEWYLSIDSDEWFDEDISDLVRFLTSKKRREFITGAVVVRNYTDKDLQDYGDLTGVRMKRMDTGHRFKGRVHEALPLKEGEVVFRAKTILHHDGYVIEGGPGGKPKHDRNMPLLEKMLEEQPKSLRLLLECVESARNAEEQERYLHRGLEGIEEKWTGWESFGPAIFRYGIALSREKEGETAERAEIYARMMELFPDSPYTTIDAACSMFHLYNGAEQYEQAIPYGQQYLKALAKYNSGDAEMQRATLYGTLTMASALKERYLRLLLASAYYEVKRYDEALDMLLSLDVDKFNGELTRNYVGTLMNLQSFYGKDLSRYMVEAWEKLTAPETEEALLQERKHAVAVVAGNCFQKPWREKETDEGRAHAYTLFLPLKDKCETGLAAAVLETRDSVALEELLRNVEDWSKFSIHALAHALEHRVRFPLPGREMKIEEMDALADRLGNTGDIASLAMESADETDTLDGLCWSRGLFLSAMNAEAERQRQTKSVLQSAGSLGEFEEDAGQTEESMALIRAFAGLESKFLSAFYAPAALSEEGLFMLPPMHRFGWHCVRAFQALDADDAVGYARELKAGLTACEMMQPVVEFLMKHTPELQEPQPSAELLALAERVRTMLAAYPADDPAVAALKSSPAYQKVAHLIEGEPA